MPSSGSGLTKEQPFKKRVQRLNTRLDNMDTTDKSSHTWIYVTAALLLMGAFLSWIFLG